MSDQQSGPDPYVAVIADLKRRRDDIDMTIKNLEALRGNRPAALQVANASSSSETSQAVVETAGMFLGMSIVDAAKKLLGMRKRTMSNTEILAELKAGGLVLTGADPLNVVGSVLTRRFNNVGDVVRVGRGIWGLKEWYPGRNFKTAKGAEPGRADSGETESTSDDPSSMIADLEHRLSNPLRAVPDE